MTPSCDQRQKAYVYGFPMVAAYKAMVEFNVDKTSSQFKTPFNTIWNDAQTFTPKDTAIPTPNSDTPYTMVQGDPARRGQLEPARPAARAMM